MLRASAAAAGRRGGRRDRRQRRDRPGAVAARRAHRAALADWLLGQAACAPRRLRAAAADAPLPAAAAAAALRRSAPTRAATTRRWRAGRRRAATSRASTIALDARRRRRWRATAFIPASRSTAPAARRWPQPHRRRSWPRLRHSETTADEPATARPSSSPAPRAASAWRSPCVPRATAPTSSIAAKTAETNPKLPGTIHSAAAEIEAAGGQALAVQCDIRDEASVLAAVAAGGRALRRHRHPGQQRQRDQPDADAGDADEALRPDVRRQRARHLPVHPGLPAAS